MSTAPSRRPPAPSPAPTGIDYLGLVAAAHDEEAGTGAKIDFAQLAMFTGDQNQEQQRPGHPGPPTSAWPAPRSASGSPPRTCSPARPTPRRSPGSASASSRPRWEWSPGTSARARRWRCAPRSPRLDPTRHQVIYIANPAFGTRGLYVTIVRALGARPRYLKAELMAQASDLLAAETAERHRRVVLICDEAHLLQPDQLEELRLLTNAEMDSASPFAGILAGQPTLNRQLRMGMFAALDQRIATRFTIKPMDLAESAAYLRHHLALAGREEPLFADDAIARLHRVASGLPRALNNAATAALIAAAAAGKDLVDDACAKKAVAELTRD